LKRGGERQNKKEKRRRAHPKSNKLVDRVFSSSVRRIFQSSELLVFMMNRELPEIKKLGRER